MANTGASVKKVIQELVVPELQEIKLGFRELKVEIKRLDEKIDSLHNEMSIRFEAMDEKIDSLHNEMNIRFEVINDKIEIKLEFKDKFTALEAKVSELAAALNAR